jgi:outer membrane protein TolC
MKQRFSGFNLMGWLQRLTGVIIYSAVFTTIALPLSGLAQTLEVAPSDTPAATIVELDLPELITIVIQGNRELKNAVLERIVQQQVLQEAESRFDPQLTPNVSLQVRQDLSDRSDFEELDESDRTDLDENLETSLSLNTILGTEITLSVNPIDEDERVNLSITQPLLRGAGRAVNEAPVNQARITETSNILDLRQRVIDTITTSITQYTTLIQQQETVRIQEQALERRQQQFEIINALVEVGRRARVELIDAERSLAEAERDLQNARNQLAQANTDLLNLIGTDAAIQFVVPPAVFTQLFEESLRRVPDFQLNRLIETAYQTRPDYQQATLNIELEELGLLVARDNQRWSLDLEGNTLLGDTSREVTAALQLSRTFGDESLRTAVERSRVSILQRQNTLLQLTETIRNEVSTQLGNVNLNLAEIEAAQQATEAAELQLQATQERFRRGIGGITLSNIIDSEENLVNAQNAELQARISFLNSIAELDQSVGITLETWQPFVELNPDLIPVPQAD